MHLRFRIVGLAGPGKDRDLAFVADGLSGLQVIQVFQREFYPENNIGQSLMVSGLDGFVVSAKLTTLQTGGVSWELSANGGGNWQTFFPDGNWYAFNEPGADLRWRSTLSWLGLSPAVSELTLSWVEQYVTPVSGPTEHSQFELHEAVPNPFNPSTMISFVLAEASAVTLRVYDLSGHLVRTLLNGTELSRGHYEEEWNGLNDTGRSLAAGVYFYRLDAGRYSETKRMVWVT